MLGFINWRRFIYYITPETIYCPCVAQIRFILIPEITTKTRQDIKVVLKTVNGRQSSTVIPKRLETDKVSPMSLPALTEYPGHCPGSGKPWSTLWILWVEEMELESVETNIARVFRLGYETAESYMEKQSQRCAEGPLKYRTPWWQEATVGWGRNHGKGLEETVRWTHTRE